jgi:AraC-like DNA-binding protein/mannose-6-phosphate isomerase-like protein (cupin superfamily)
MRTNRLRGEDARSANRVDVAHWYVTRDGLECLEATYTEHVFGRHVHDTYAIGVTLSGVQRFWCAGVTHDATAGSVMVIPPGQSHDGESGTSGSYSYRMLYVPPAVLASAIEDATGKIDRAIRAPASAVVSDATLARSINKAWLAQTCADSSAADELLESALLGLLERHGGVLLPAHRGGGASRLELVREFIHANLHRDIRVAELAQLASLSRFQLTRQFALAFGLPLHAYHMQLRLDEAKRRLRLGEGLSQVASSLGFCDQSHFNRRFRSVFGVPPGVWKQAISCGTRAEISRRTGRATE